MARSSLRITMETVARDARVSRATVSRVLSGETPVDAKTRDRVLASCRKLGYVRNEAATQLARRSSALIGLLLRDARNPMYATLNESLLQSTSERGLFITTMSTGQTSQQRREEIQLSRLVSLRPAGLFVASGLIAAQDILHYAHQVPTIVLPRYEPRLDLNVVGYDEAQHGIMLAQTVIAAGHKRVAVAVTPKFVSPAEHIRTTTIVKVLSEAGIAVTRIRGAKLFYDHDAMFERVQDGISANRFTAIMFANDIRALEFMVRAQGTGYRIPGDIAVTGCDGLGLAVAVSGLTTVRVPVEKVCERAVAHMDRLIKSSRNTAASVTSPIRELYAGQIVNGRTLE